MQTSEWVFLRACVSVCVRVKNAGVLSIISVVGDIIENKRAF